MGDSVLRKIGEEKVFPCKEDVGDHAAITSAIASVIAFAMPRLLLVILVLMLNATC